METSRRRFIQAGALTAANAAMGVGMVTSGAKAQAQMSTRIQMSGLLMHGRWPLKDHIPFRYSGWDVLLVQSPLHEPKMKIPLANVINPVGFTRDRYTPELGVWDLKGRDVVIYRDGVARGVVEGIHNKRGTVGGKPNTCPDPKNDDEFLDITWLADLDKILKNAAISEVWKDPKTVWADPTTISAVVSRVRLPEGTIAAARPSRQEYENFKVSYETTAYPAQFTADLTRFTSTPATAITIELSQTLGAPTTLTLTGSGTIPIYIENHNPEPTHDKNNYWMHHFNPYRRLLQEQPDDKFRPVVNACGGNHPDPPFYCIPPAANFLP